MTRDEILKKVKQYEAKWGKLGTGDIMHSSESDEKKTDKTTSQKDEYYSYRQKVLDGKNKNRIAHSATISPDDLNERYLNEQLYNAKLIHGYIPKKQHEDHAYLYIDDNGNYIYPDDVNKGKTGRQTKQNVDPNNKTIGVNTNSNNQRMTDEEIKADVQKSEDRQKNKQGDIVRKYADLARNAGPKAAAEEFMKKDKDVEELRNLLNEYIGNGMISYDEKSNAVSIDDSNLNSYFKAVLKDIENSINEIVTASGKQAVYEAIKIMINDELKSIASKQKSSSGFDTLVGDTAKRMKQSAITNDEFYNDYKEFKKKVEAGEKKNTLVHSATISPEELNSRYLQDMKKHSVMIHRNI